MALYTCISVDKMDHDVTKGGIGKQMAEKACIFFSKMYNTPGVLDIFITKHIKVCLKKK